MLKNHKHCIPPGLHGTWEFCPPSVGYPVGFITGGFPITNFKFSFISSGRINGPAFPHVFKKKKNMQHDARKM